MRPDAPSADEVGDQARDAFGLPALDRCELLRRGFNDAYLIEADGSRWVLRLYLDGKYYVSGPDDFRFELALLRHLADEGLPVVAAERDALVWLPLGRWAALFPHTGGEPPAEVPSPDRIEDFGRTIGRLHAAADAFATELPRYHLDRRYLLDEPVRLMDEVLRGAGEPEGIAPWAPLLEAIGDRIDSVGRDPGVYGVIHADLHTGNLHAVGDGFVLLDFDHSGYGWRAYDLATLRLVVGRDGWDPLLAGYRTVREPTEAELGAVGAFALARLVWDTGDVLAMYPAWGVERSPKDAERVTSTLNELTELRGRMDEDLHLT